MGENAELQKEIRWLLDEKYQGRRTQEAEEDIASLKKGEHVDYLIGFVQFLGCKIDLSKHPFIPEPETEYWVGKAIEDIRQSAIIRKPSAIRCLDVFAGSGCVGIAVARHIPSVIVDFVEKDKKFCQQIEINTKLNYINSSRYNIIQSNLFNKLSVPSSISQFVHMHKLEDKLGQVKYDYILANPPYVPEKNKKSVEKSVLENEPLTAIFGGTDGLNYIREFLKEAKNYLRKGSLSASWRSKIYMEFDSNQKDQIPKLLKEYGYSNFEIFRDQYGKWRFTIASA